MRELDELFATLAKSAFRSKQTPFRMHPVFVVQPATACCCRGCLEK